MPGAAVSPAPLPSLPPVEHPLNTRGPQIKFMVLPELLKNSPALTKVAGMKAKAAPKPFKGKATKKAA